MSSQEIRVSYLSGQIRKHSLNLKYDTPKYSSGVELSYLINTRGDKGWDAYWGKPIIDMSAIGINFGNNDVLGTAYGVVPSLQFNLINRPDTKLGLSFGAGGSYLTKKYNYTYNPLNNAIGSHLNNTTRFRLVLRHKNFSLGGNLYHFSNGSTYTPNSGINVVVANISYQFGTNKKSNNIIEYQRKDFAEEAKSKSEKHKNWGLDIMYVNGFNQTSVPSGPSYNIRSISLGGYKSLGPYIRLHFGLEYEYNETIYNFYLNDFSTKKEAHDLAYNAVFYFGCELFFGNIGFRPKLGYYLPYPIPEAGDPFYIKLETHYYPLGRNKKISPYIGMALKSHYAVAQYASIEGGINF